MARSPKLLIIGLDCAEPSLVFERWRADLPNLRRLMEGGAYGRLNSCIPCITVPAWACMTSSRDPGQLGIYGFHNRLDHSYQPMRVANARSMPAPRIWDLLSHAGKQVIVVGAPPTYPPNPVNGVMVGCFLTPTTANSYTYPAALGAEITGLVGEYLVDTPNFRTERKAELLEQIYTMTERRFQVVKHLMHSRPWDLCMFVEIGVDRIHHGFWSCHDPLHRTFRPDNPYQNAIYDYYRYIDERIGELCAMIDDDTAVLVVSDHGATRMDGAICLNEWLIARGYLTLKRAPAQITRLEHCEIDWSRTVAWGGGGYYGRIFLNVQGREPAGIVAPGAYAELRAALAEELQAIPDAAGRPLSNRVFTPEAIYRDCRNVPPDLLVYFGDLAWRAVGSVGNNAIHTFDNDTGPDDANHAEAGLFIYHHPRRRAQGQVEALNLFDIAPIALNQFQMAAPRTMIGATPGWLT